MEYNTANVELVSKLLDTLAEGIADLVIRKITDSSSNMLNTIQYKVRTENIEGLEEQVKEWANDVVEEAVNGLEFEVNVR